MNYDPESCILARAFGEGDNEIVAQFIQYFPWPDFDFNVRGKPLARWRDRSNVGLRFGVSGPFMTQYVMSAPAPGAGSLMLFMRGQLDNGDPTQADDPSLPGSERAARLVALEGSISSVTLRSSGSDVTLELGSMLAPMAAMRKCTSELVQSWGFSQDYMLALTALPKPVGSPASWLRSDDYPSRSKVRGEQARIRFRLMVDSAGKPTDCIVQSSIGGADFAKLTCDLLKRRARFTPARNKDGTSVASVYVRGVNWVF